MHRVHICNGKSLKYILTVSFAWRERLLPRSTRRLDCFVAKVVVVFVVVVVTTTVASSCFFFIIALAVVVVVVVVVVDEASSIRRARISVSVVENYYKIQACNI